MDITSLISVSELTALGSVILTDIALAGDNAIVVGMAAAALPADDLGGRLRALGLEPIPKLNFSSSRPMAA